MMIGICIVTAESQPCIQSGTDRELGYGARQLCRSFGGNLQHLDRWHKCTTRQAGEQISCLLLKCCAINDDIGDHVMPEFSIF